VTATSPRAVTATAEIGISAAMGLSLTAAGGPGTVVVVVGGAVVGGEVIRGAVVGTVVMMPLLAPHLIPGLEVSPWAIAKPLLLTVLLPLVIAVVFKLRAPAAAGKLFPIAKKLAGIATLLLLVFCLGLYWKPLLGAIGHWGPLAQILFILITAAIAFLIAPGYKPAQRKAMSLGICNPNGGAMMVAITAFPTVDPELLLMILISIPVPIIVWSLIARFYASKIPTTP